MKKISIILLVLALSHGYVIIRVNVELFLFFVV